MQAPAKTVRILDRGKVFLHAHLINKETYLRHSFKCKAIKNKKILEVRKNIQCHNNSAIIRLQEKRKDD